MGSKAACARRLLLAITMSAVVGCWGRASDDARACAGDESCVEGQVCRQARCTPACEDGHWVGERVTVRAAVERREAKIAACDRGYWVRYESGIEEQVDKTRLQSATAVQGL